jgi:DIM1 family U5 snRNP protein
MRQDETLFKIAERVKNFAVIYLCDIDQVGPPSSHASDES